MTREQAKELETKLTAAGYKKYTQALSGNETFGYFKSGGVKYNDQGEKTIEYQIEYRFWDWSKYGESGNLEFGVDVIVISSSSKRADLELTTDELGIARIEKIAENFNKFCKENEIGLY